MGKFAYRLLGSLLAVAGFMVAPTVAEAAQAVCPAYAMSARNITVSPYTISLADQCALLVVKASNATITVPAPGSQVDLSVGYTTWVVNNTLGNITIAGTVNGLVNPVIPQGASLNLYTDSANWYGVNTVSSIGAGTGDVVGPAGAVADNITSFNGGTGKAVKDSGVAVSSLVPGTRTITGAGLLAGGGDLTANRTITFGSVNASTLLGNPTGAPAVPTVITLGTNLTFAGTVLNAAGGSASAVGPSGDIQTSLGSGIFGSFTPAAGVTTLLTTPSSANLLAALTTKTGTGLAVFGTSPTLTTPALGTPSAAVLTNATGLPISTGVSGLGTGVATLLTTPSSANLLAALTTKTGTGNAVFGTAPTMTAVTLGDITGSTQCLHASTLGVVTGTGSDCGAGGGGSWNLTDGTHSLTGVSALTVDATSFVVGGTAGAATLGRLCPEATTTLGDANSAISVGKIARINATLTAARSYSMPAIAQYAVGCQLTIVDSNRTASASNTATITRNADNATLNLGTTFPAISTAGFFTTWESDGSNWSLVGNGTVATLQAAQIYFGNASNQTVAGVPTGDVIPNSSNAWTIQASANVAKAPSNLTVNALTKGDGTKNISASTVVDTGGGVTIGSPTGGVQGAGTLNASNVFVNGVAVGTSGGNVSNSGTPTVGQVGVWVDATHLQGTTTLAKAAGGTAATTGSGAATNLSLGYLSAEDNALHSITGTLTETKLASCAFPAGSIGATGSIRVSAIGSRAAGGTSSGTFKLKIGTVNDTSGTQVWTQAMGTTLLSMGISSRIANRAANSQLAYPSASPGSTVTPLVTTAIDTSASTLFAVITATLGNTGDTMSSESLACEVMPPGGN